MMAGATAFTPTPSGPELVHTFSPALARWGALAASAIAQPNTRARNDAGRRRERMGFACGRVAMSVLLALRHPQGACRAAPIPHFDLRRVYRRRSVNFCL